MWVRAQGTEIAKTICFQEYFHFDIKVSWSGMTESEKEDLATWLNQRAEQLAECRRVENQEYEERQRSMVKNTILSRKCKIARGPFAFLLVVQY
jgi:hypothetical protein